MPQQAEFRVDVLDANGTRLGDGPLTTVLALEDTRSLDAVGGAQFALPAEDPRTALIDAGSQFDVYDRVDGYLGRFLYRSKALDTGAKGGSRLTVACHDQLVELARTNVYFSRTYTNTAVDTVVEALAALAGWTATCDSGIGNTTVAYEGDAVITALDVLRDRWGKHFRLSDTPSQLDFGAFGTDSGVVLASLRGQVQANFANNPYLALVENIRLVEEGDDLYNRVVALGAGQGVAQLKLGDATYTGEYSVQVGVNADGSAYYYIEDAASVALYGRRVKVLSFPTIRPITNSAANIIYAANALKAAAEAYLNRHKAPRLTYAVTVRGLRQAVRVGDLVRLQYRGIVDDYAFIDVDELFYLMDVTRRRTAEGERSAVLTIATIAERQVDDREILIDVINDMKALKVSVPVTISRDAVGPYVKRMDSTHTAEFTVRIGNEVTAVNYAILRFRTSPLKSSVTGTSSGGGSFGTTDDGGSLQTSSNGGSLQTSNNGGSAQTSDGSNTTTTAGGSSHSHSVTPLAHSHNLSILDTSVGTTVRFDSGGPRLTAFTNTGGGTNIVTSNSAGADAVSSVADSSHTHGFNHTHTLNTTHNHTLNTTHNHTLNTTHNHTLNVASHNHAMAYGIFADTTYPQTISLAINGVDVTSALGGTWAASNATVEVEVDITTYLVNAVGGLRQNHRVEFSCGSGQGEIEVEVDTLMSIQAITVT